LPVIREQGLFFVKIKKETGEVKILKLIIV
jgi:hypothetical protein